VKTPARFLRAHTLCASVWNGGSVGATATVSMPARQKRAHLVTEQNRGSRELCYTHFIFLLSSPFAFSECVSFYVFEQPRPKKDIDIYHLIV
jgi:hypothetical protein